MAPISGRVTNSLDLFSCLATPNLEPVLGPVLGSQNRIQEWSSAAAVWVVLHVLQHVSSKEKHTRRAKKLFQRFPTNTCELVCDNVRISFPGLCVCVCAHVYWRRPGLKPNSLRGYNVRETIKNTLQIHGSRPAPPRKPRCLNNVGASVGPGMETRNREDPRVGNKEPTMT